MNRMRVADIIANYRPGSRDDAWTWDDEATELFTHGDMAGRTSLLLADIEANGVHDPVMLGSDGRVWDGHHRIVCALRLGIESLPVELPR